MIVSLCSEKGAPGVSTVAALMALAWPGDRVLVDVDPSGGDLGFRMRSEPSAPALASSPSIATLAAAARTGLGLDGLMGHSQPTTIGVPVIPGCATAERYQALSGLWPGVVEALSSAPGTVICDLGRMHGAEASTARIAQASAAVLLLARGDMASLWRLRERVPALSAAVADRNGGRNPLHVVMRGPAKERSRLLGDTAAMLESIGSPVTVAGYIPEDPRGIADLWSGAGVTRRLAGSDAFRSVQTLVEYLLANSPALAGSSVTGAAFAPPQGVASSKDQVKVGLP